MTSLGIVAHSLTETQISETPPSQPKGGNLEKLVTHLFCQRLPDVLLKAEGDGIDLKKFKRLSANFKITMVNPVISPKKHKASFKLNIANYITPNIVDISEEIISSQKLSALPSAAGYQGKLKCTIILDERVYEIIELFTMRVRTKSHPSIETQFEVMDEKMSETVRIELPDDVPLKPHTIAAYMMAYVYKVAKERFKSVDDVILDICCNFEPVRKLKFKGDALEKCDEKKIIKLLEKNELIPKLPFNTPISFYLQMTSKDKKDKSITTVQDFIFPMASDEMRS